ncbi:hypothetical protein AMECASPLE_004198 [Ameca splendens]|uniref:Secreted protein n=1 Tax=Ameca splendens TaxID=208324 RepID=A0ABV0ZUN5_9TELE
MERLRRAVGAVTGWFGSVAAGLSSGNKERRSEDRTLRSLHKPFRYPVYDCCYTGPRGCNSTMQEALHHEDQGALQTINGSHVMQKHCRSN